MDVPADMEDALDTACLDRVFAEPDFMRLLLSEALTGELDSPEITAQQAPLVRGVFDCIDFGQAIAAEAALDGITLSPTSVECLSRQFRELGFVEYFIEGTEPSDADLGAMVIDCLSTEELLELGGS